MPAVEVPSDSQPVGDWLTVKEVAAWLKVSDHHVRRTMAKWPGCKPINVGKSETQPDWRFNRNQLIAALAQRSGE